MTAFVETCVQTLAGTAVAVERRSRSRGVPRARRLLKLLADRKRILVTTHIHPDPDALGSAMAMTVLLKRRLGANSAGQDGEEATQVTLAAKGRIGGGVNEAFLRATGLKVTPWEEIDPTSFDAIVLLDTQPQFAFNPLPQDVQVTAVIDHHRGRGRKSGVPYWDVRRDVGATSSIVFSYFMDLEEQLTPDLAAILLYAIESDLAGAAGTPGELDNVALSSLTLTADPRKLYQMRFTSLPRGYYAVFAQALSNAQYQDNAVISHLDSIESMEQPAVMADFLVRFEQAQWALVTAKSEDKLVMSLRTQSPDRSAADVMKRIIGRLGEGGGHRTKAGGYIALNRVPPLDIVKLRKRIWKRFLCAVGLKPGKATKLVP